MVDTHAYLSLTLFHGIFFWLMCQFILLVAFNENQSLTHHAAIHIDIQVCRLLVIVFV